MLVCPRVDSFVYTLLLENVNRNGSLVWFKASGFCHTIHYGSSVGLLSVILLLPCVIGTLQFWVSRTCSFIHSYT